MTEPRGTEDGGDPTADFLAEVVPGETPWRTERPAEAEPEVYTVVQPAQKWARTRAVGRGAAKAAPYVQAAAVVGWLVTEAFEAGQSGGSA